MGISVPFFSPSLQLDVTCSSIENTIMDALRHAVDFLFFGCNCQSL